jgi:hypothetical protein
MVETKIGEQIFYRLGREKISSYRRETLAYCPETNTLVRLIKTPDETSFEIENPSEPPSIPENAKQYKLPEADWAEFQDILRQREAIKQGIGDLSIRYDGLSKRAAKYLFEEDVITSF